MTADGKTMTEDKQSSGIRPRRRWRERLRQELIDNPVMRKELRGRMRGRRAFVVLTIYLLVLSCLTSVIYFAYASAAQQPYGPDSYLIGKIVFGGVLGIQLLLVVFITPAFTAGTISGERERQTYDLLRTTLLPARALVVGKLASALSYILLLILAAVPLESLAFLLGGVALEEIVVSQIILLVTALAYGAASTYFSSIMKSTLSATVVSYAFTLLSTAGLLILFSVLVPILSMFGTIFFADDPHWLLLLALIYVGGFLVAINPIATIILSEVVLIQEQTLYFFKISLPTSSGPVQDIWLISPWVVYVLFHLLIAGLGFWLSVRRVKRQER